MERSRGLCHSCTAGNRPCCILICRSATCSLRIGRCAARCRACRAVLHGEQRWTDSKGAVQRLRRRCGRAWMHDRVSCARCQPWLRLQGRPRKRCSHRLQVCTVAVLQGRQSICLQRGRCHRVGHRCCAGARGHRKCCRRDKQNAWVASKGQRCPRMTLEMWRRLHNVQPASVPLPCNYVQRSGSLVTWLAVRTNCHNPRQMQGGAHRLQRLCEQGTDTAEALPFCSDVLVCCLDESCQALSICAVQVNATALIARAKPALCYISRVWQAPSTSHMALV